MFRFAGSHAGRCRIAAAPSSLLCPLLVSRRTVIPGSIPTDSSGGWETRRGHHLSSSAGLHSKVKTACGRSFDPQIYNELLQACCDAQWLGAIQRELLTDAEYIAHLRQNGGAARELRVLTDKSQHDDEFMTKLLEKVKTDEKVALALCAVQDSYMRIREKRDRHETQIAADGGHDPYASMKGHQSPFGSERPQF